MGRDSQLTNTPELPKCPGFQSPWCQEPVEKLPHDTRRLLGCFIGEWQHLGLRPLLITGIIRDVLKNHFNVKENIESEYLKENLWTPERNTGILIESIHRWREELVEKRPAVIIKRNAMRNLRIARQDRLGIDRQGDSNFATLWVGSHTLFCIHGTGASTEILATEVQREMTQFGPFIADSFGFFKFQCTEVGAVSEIEEATENFVVPLTIGWAYQETWRLTQESHKLSAIHFNFDLDG